MNKLENRFITEGCLFANAKTCAEITTDVAIKFAEWSQNRYFYSNVEKKWSTEFKIYEGELFTTQELFEEFINNHYGK